MYRIAFKKLFNTFLMGSIILSFLAPLEKAVAVVDYWGIKGKKQEVKEEKPRAQKEKKKQERRSKTVIAEKEPTKEEIWQASLKWYEEKIKREKPPVEYFYYKNPEKYKDVMWKWFSWKKENSSRLTKPLLMYARTEGVDFDEAVKYLVKHDYRIMYFYKPDCSYCIASKEEVERIATYLPVHRINVERDPRTAILWNVTSTPTYIAVSPKDRVAFRFIGFGFSTEIITDFYKKALMYSRQKRSGQ